MRTNRRLHSKPVKKVKPIETEDELKAKADAGIMAGLATTLEGINKKLDLLIKKDEKVHQEIDKKPAEKPVDKPADLPDGKAGKPAEKLEEQIAETK
jgi:hypothetical protein